MKAILTVFLKGFTGWIRVGQEMNRTGLGLSIVKHIIEAHGHNVQVRSMEGEGSTFFFTLTKI